MFKYLAGNSISKALKVAKKNYRIGKIPVINYAVEHNNSKTIYNEYVKLSNEINDNFRIAIKLSSFNYDKVIINDIY